MLDDEPIKHEYYWAWSMDDNPKYNPYDTNDLAYRVFRSTSTTKGVPVTEPMTKAEAIAKCKQIVMLTEGRELQ